MKIKYANIIPLIGGMTIGNKQAVGHNPEFIVSWDAFGKNDSHIVNYLNDVPYHVLPEGGEDKITPQIRNQYFEKTSNRIFIAYKILCKNISYASKLKIDIRTLTFFCVDYRVTSLIIKGRSIGCP